MKPKYLGLELDRIKKCALAAAFATQFVIVQDCQLLNQLFHHRKQLVSQLLDLLRGNYLFNKLYIASLGIRIISRGTERREAVIRIDRVSYLYIRL